MGNESIYVQRKMQEYLVGINTICLCNINKEARKFVFMSNETLQSRELQSLADKLGMNLNGKFDTKHEARRYQDELQSFQFALFVKWQRGFKPLEE